MEPTVIYHDENFLVLNKPAGVLVHHIRDKELRMGETTVADWLLKNYPEVRAVGDDPEQRPGIVHRLDKDTSGVLAVARNQFAFLYLKKLFQLRQVKKTYCALVYGALKETEGTINRPIGIISGSIKRTIHIGHARLPKEAITKYRVTKILHLMVQNDGKEWIPDRVGNDNKEVICSLLEVELLTGRTHQIRVHLASIGHPIVGDKLYGPKMQPIALDRHFLHADSIEFTLPNNNRLKIGADLPEELSLILKGEV